MGATILVAEDHPDSLELMRYLLQAHGFAVLCAPDGERALALARSHRPDLIICDLQMPKLNGYEVCRALRADPEMARVPLIAVTAFSMLGDREKVLAAGFDGYFSKPIEPEGFVTGLKPYLSPPLHPAPRGGASKEA